MLLHELLLLPQQRGGRGHLVDLGRELIEEAIGTSPQRVDFIHPLAVTLHDAHQQAEPADEVGHVGRVEDDLESRGIALVGADQPILKSRDGDFELPAGQRELLLQPRHVLLGFLEGQHTEIVFLDGAREVLVDGVEFDRRPVDLHLLGRDRACQQFELPKPLEDLRGRRRRQGDRGRAAGNGRGSGSWPGP